MTDKSIVEELDDTAIQLLRRIRGDSSLTPEQSAIFQEQVKAFDVVARWASSRTALIAKEEPKENAFAGIKRQFREHDSKGRRRRGFRPPASESGASVIDFAAATSSSSDPGPVED